MSGWAHGPHTTPPDDPTEDADPAGFLEDPVQVAFVNGERRLLLNEGGNTERLAFFSDAVFAIALTLLVLDIRLPEVPEEQVSEAVVGLLPKFGAFLVSFLIIATNWLTHFRRFRLMTGYDGWVIRQNFALLFLIALVPFPAALFAEHAPNAWAVALYAGTLGLTGLVQLWGWWYAYHRGLLSPIVTRTDYVLRRNALLVLPLMFLGTLPLLVVNPFAVLWAWMVFPVLMMAMRLVNRRVRQRAQRAPASSSAG